MRRPELRASSTSADESTPRPRSAQSSPKKSAQRQAGTIGSSIGTPCGGRYITSRANSPERADDKMDARFRHGWRAGNTVRSTLILRRHTSTCTGIVNSSASVRLLCGAMVRSSCVWLLSALGCHGTPPRVVWLDSSSLWWSLLSESTNSFTSTYPMAIVSASESTIRTRCIARTGALMRRRCSR